MRLADGCLLVVDVVEGLMLNAERLLRHAVQARYGRYTRDIYGRCRGDVGEM